MLANLMLFCCIAVAASLTDRAWEAYVANLPGSVGVIADIGRERSLMELAWMSKAAYELTSKDSISDGEYYEKLVAKGWNVSEAHPQSDYRLQVNTLLAMAVFTHHNDNLAVVAFKGTYVGSLSDLELDAINIIGRKEPLAPMRAGIELVAKYQQRGWKVMVTGHSLGGYMAEVVGTRLQISGVGFCAPGSHSLNPWAYDHGGDAHAGFQNVNFKPDLIGNIKILTNIHPQWSVYVTDYAPIPQHSIVKMATSMEARGPEWTNLNVVSKCESRRTGYYTRVTPHTGSSLPELTCGEVKSMYNTSRCCREPSNVLLNRTCTEVKLAYKNNGCCGNPSKQMVL